MTVLAPFPDGEFITCSGNAPRWLAEDDNGCPIWTKKCTQATRFTRKTFNQMLTMNKWLEDAEFWFQR